MKTIITLDRANQPYGYPQLDGSGNLNVTGSFSGSFTGTIIGTASLASTASYVDPLNQNLELTGSLNVSGSINLNGVDINSLMIAYSIALG